MTSGSSDDDAFRRALCRVAPKIARPLPWIGHGDPWAILVSEVMLQQTQTIRVIEPWERFITRFATPRACADAPLSSVVRLWSGLGYHRRARYLHDAARMIRDQYDGVVPHDVVALRRLPGVGEYTACAVASFAFGVPVAVIDTNVGRVLARALRNRPLRPAEARLVAQGLLPSRGVTQFNQAMLDLGAQFCRARPDCEVCPVSAVCRWRREGGEDPAPSSAGVSRAQTKFAGSDRQLRGRVLAELRDAPCSRSQLGARLSEMMTSRVEMALLALERDGLVERRGRFIRLAGD